MNLAFFYADNPQEWNSSEWRCLIPAEAINRTGRHSAQLLHIQEFANQTPAGKAACEKADVIMLERNLVGSVLRGIQHWRAQDKIIIANFDDAYDLLLPNNPAYPYWIEGVSRANGKPVAKIDPVPLTQFRWAMRLVNGAAVPSRRLAADWQSYTEVQYLPNYVDLNRYLSVSRPAHDGIIIGWGGSVSHLQSFTESGVLQALKQICKARPQVKVMFCGNDKRVFERLPLPEEQKILHPWVPFREWPTVLANFDIGIAPLAGPYDDRRSWIKVLEYMLMKIPWVASNSPAYQDVRQYGWLVNNTPSAWERILLDMIDHLEDYRQEAERDAYLFALAQDINENVERIIDLMTAFGEGVRI